MKSVSQHAPVPNPEAVAAPNHQICALRKPLKGLTPPAQAPTSNGSATSLPDVALRLLPHISVRMFNPAVGQFLDLRRKLRVPGDPIGDPRELLAWLSSYRRPIGTWSES